MDQNVISFPGLGIEPFEVSPVAFRIFGWPVAWYGIIITCGFLVAFAYAYYRAKKESFHTDDLVDYLLYGMIFGVVGARLYYVLTKLDTFVVEGDILKTLKNIVAVWGGGLAIYGGIIGGALTVLIVARLKKQSVLQVLDLIIPGVALAQSIGRWGNFINAEAHGGVTDLPWRMGIRTPRMLEMIYVHPTFLYESLWNLIGFFLLHFFVVKKRKYYGTAFLCYVAWYGFGRMLIEGLRTDSLLIPGTEIRISQMLAFVSMLVALSLLIIFAVLGRTSKGLSPLPAEDTPESDDPLLDEDAAVTTDSLTDSDANKSDETEMEEPHEHH